MMISDQRTRHAMIVGLSALKDTHTQVRRMWRRAFVFHDLAERTPRWHFKAKKRRRREADSSLAVYHVLRYGDQAIARLGRRGRTSPREA
jgi:hypothetical protein